MATFEKSQQFVGLAEGGYGNDPDDDGNWYNGILIGTNWGIAAPTLAAYLGRTPSASEMKNLPRATAEAILRKNFWDRNNLGKLNNQSVATMIYDGTVNQGVYGMRYVVEKALTKLKKPLVYYKVFTIDGIALLNKLDQKLLFYAIKDARANRYAANKSSKYYNGWINRLNKIQYVDQPKGANGLMLSALAILGIGLLFLGL